MSYIVINQLHKIWKQEYEPEFETNATYGNSKPIVNSFIWVRMLGSKSKEGPEAISV